MNTKIRRRLSLSALALAAFASWPMSGFAQSWEVHSGPNPQREQLRGVTDVQFCTGGGQAAVGTQRASASGGFENLVVERKDTATPTGIPSWGFSYDSGRSDRGDGIVEYTDGSGFAIVGTFDALTAPTQTRLTISKVDCNGTMLWRRSYGTTVGVNIAWDIIRANTGDASFGTAAGDLIALGEYTAGGVKYVRVVRVRSNGTLIWMRDYNTPSGAPLFGRGIAEVNTPSLTDNLVVAGGIANHAAIFQIDGNNGNFLCGSRLPGQGVSRFNDIAPHGTATIAPGFTPVGETRTSAVGALPQAFVASYRNIGCVLQRQVHWGSPNESETAQAVTTTRTNTFSGVPVGQLLIAGNVAGPFLGVNSRDVWTHLMVPIQLTAFPGFIGQRYGTQTFGLAGAETVMDVAEGSNGAHFVGATRSNWDGLNDPLDGYSVRMSGGGMRTFCSVPWSRPITALFPNGLLTVTPNPILPTIPLPPLPRSPLPAALCCGIGP